MKNIKDIRRELNQIQEWDIEAMSTIIMRFEDFIKGNHVTEQTVKELDGIIAELLIMRTKFGYNLLQWSKQGYHLD